MICLGEGRSAEVEGAFLLKKASGWALGAIEGLLVRVLGLCVGWVAGGVGGV